MNPEMDVGTNKKAFQINLEHQALRDVCRNWCRPGSGATLFQVGGASGTIAKTMSAYDMQFSDAIYGATDRYVSRVRLQTMLGHEYRS